jgi:hypothetical protein
MVESMPGFQMSLIEWNEMPSLVQWHEQTKGENSCG